MLQNNNKKNTGGVRPELRRLGLRHTRGGRNRARLIVSEENCHTNTF